VLHASLVVKIVLLILAGMSLASWFIIGTKLARLRQAQLQSATFLDFFWSKDEGNVWSAERLEAVYARLSSVEGSPLGRVFHAGYVELAKTMQAGGRSGDVENVERALRRASSNELTRLENFLPFLATTGSVGPFIGLFGTVWGIMNSFRQIAASHDTSLAVVAPGIAEALFATAMGLVAAIPASVAYNHLSTSVNRIASRLEGFAEEFAAILSRQLDEKAR
jgi:biopolymer transport protein TolQ